MSSAGGDLTGGSSADLSAEVAAEQALPLPTEGLAPVVEELWPGGAWPPPSVWSVGSGRPGSTRPLSARSGAGAPGPAPCWVVADGPPDVVALAEALPSVHALPVPSSGHLRDPVAFAGQVQRALPTRERVLRGFVDTGPLTLSPGWPGDPADLPSRGVPAGTLGGRDTSVGGGR